MKIEDILQALPSKEDIASTVGLEARASTTRDILTAFGIFGTGMILGAGLALLLAPKAGREIRHDIVEKVGEIGEHLRTQAPPATPANQPSA
jgi:YtxH-like protein